MPSYIALATLLDGPLHGYAIVRRAAELSDGQVRPSTGTLYALLDRAIAEGLVVAGEPYVENGRERRDYALTPEGRRRAGGRDAPARARGADGVAPAARHGGERMIRERATRVALLAYPPDVRERVGDEMTATLLDASAGSRTRFAREVAALARAGVRRAAGARRRSGRAGSWPTASAWPPCG